MRPRPLALALLLTAAGAVLLVGFWRTPVEDPWREDVQGMIAWMGDLGLPFVTYRAVDFVANILWFVPIAAIAVFVLGTRRWPWAVVGCLALSVAIELGQTYFLPLRVGSASDVLANVLGCVLGAGSALVIARMRARPTADEPAGP